MRKLLQQLVPWHTVPVQDENASVRVEDLQFLVDAVAGEVENKEKVIFKSCPFRLSV